MTNLHRQAVFIILGSLLLAGCGQSGVSDSGTIAKAPPLASPVSTPAPTATLTVDEDQTVYAIEQRIRDHMPEAVIEAPHVVVNMNFSGLDGVGKMIEGIATTPDGEKPELMVGIIIGDNAVYFALGNDDFAKSNRKGLSDAVALRSTYLAKIAKPGPVSLDDQRQLDEWWRKSTPLFGRHWTPIGDSFPVVLSINASDKERVASAVPSLLLFNSGAVRASWSVFLNFPKGEVQPWTLSQEWTWTEQDLDQLAEQGREIVKNYPSYLAKARESAAKP